MNERPKSREETPKEGGGTAWRAIPRCNNMRLRRTKIKVLMKFSRAFLRQWCKSVTMTPTDTFTSLLKPRKP